MNVTAGLVIVTPGPVMVISLVTVWVELLVTVVRACVIVTAGFVLVTVYVSVTVVV